MNAEERRQLFAQAAPADQTEIARELCRKDFASFFKMAFKIINPGTPLMWNWHLDYFCYLAGRTLPIDEKGLNPAPHLPRIHRLIINLPPRCGKSELFTVALSAFIMGHYPYERIVSASVADHLSEQFSRKTADVVTSDFFKELFPGFELAKETASLLIIKNHLGERLTTSAKGAVIGKGGNYIFLDDMQTVTQGQQESELDIEKINTVVTSSILGRVNDALRSVFICIMQRVGPGDLTDHLLQQNKYLTGDNRWMHVVIPEICQETTTFEFFGREYTWTQGEALDAYRRPLEWLKNVKIPSMSAWDWATQHLQNPVPLVGGVIPMAKFRRFDWKEVVEEKRKGEPLLRFQSWDTGNKTSSDSCPSVCGTWDVYADGIHLINVDRGKWQFPELCKQATNNFLRWKPAAVVIEDKASGQQLLQTLRNEEMRKKLGLPTMPTYSFNPQIYGDKFVRMIGRTDVIEQGEVWLPITAPWLSDYEQELLFFPKGFKDQVDMTSQALIYWKAISAVRYWIMLL